MAYTLDDIKKIVSILEQTTSFMSANLPKNEATYEEALLYLLNKGISTIVAGDIAYDNSVSGLTATNVQAAIDELKVIIDNLEAADISVVPSGSLVDLNVQAALETIYTRVDGTETRLTTLENTYIKVTHFKIIAGANGSITPPPNSDILLDEFEGEVDALVSQIDGSNTPTWESPRDAGGNVISVSSFDTGGNYVLTGTPVGNIALIYRYRVMRKDFNYLFSIGFETLDPTAEEIKIKYESNDDTNAFTDRDKAIVNGYEHTQGVAATQWNINHNLSKKPSVMIVDSADTVVEGEVEYLDINNIRLTFSAPFSGKAYLT